MRFAATAVIAALGIAAPASGSATGHFARYERSTVAVTYFVETTFMREVREMSGRELGVVVAPDLVMMNGSVATSSTTGSQPHGFRVRFAGGEEREASFVGRDEFVNMAFLRFAGGLPRGVEALRLQDAPKVGVGERVYTLGLLPENLDPMVRLETGTIIALVEHPKTMLVTDLPTAGALGAPVFSGSGRLVGILSEMGAAGPSFASGFDGEDVAYGIVLDPGTLRPLVAAPPVRGEVRRSWLGITLQALDPDKADYWGLPGTPGIIVNSVVPGSPAEAAGLQEGDILVGLDGRPIPVSQEEHVPVFVEQIGSRPVGSSMRLSGIRRGQRFEAEVALVAAPKSRGDAEVYESRTFDLTVRELVFQDYRTFDLDAEFRGVLVFRVQEGGWAGVGGLESGDIIQKVDDREIERPGDLKQVLDDATAQKKRKLVFFVQRQGRTQFITVQPRWEGQS